MGPLGVGAEDSLMRGGKQRSDLLECSIGLRAPVRSFKWISKLTVEVISTFLLHLNLHLTEMWETEGNRKQVRIFSNIVSLFHTKQLSYCNTCLFASQDISVLMLSCLRGFLLLLGKHKINAEENYAEIDNVHIVFSIRYFTIVPSTEKETALDQHFSPK